jgi:hypothetical protein
VTIARMDQNFPQLVPLAYLAFEILGKWQDRLLYVYFGSNISWRGKEMINLRIRNVVLQH